MSAHRILESPLLPLLRQDVDTDQIIPARFLKGTDKTGLENGLFAGWRFLEDGRPNPSFALNRPEHRQARFLLAGENFGCGSSREHASWALLQYGFQAVISPRFADIFRANALGNGLLAVELPAEIVAGLAEQVAQDPNVKIRIDLETCRVHLPKDITVPFEIDAFAHHCLLHGVDTLGFLLSKLPIIKDWESANPSTLDTRNLS